MRVATYIVTMLRISGIVPLILFDAFKTWARDCFIFCALNGIQRWHAVQLVHCVTIVVLVILNTPITDVW